MDVKRLPLAHTPHPRSFSSLGLPHRRYTPLLIRPFRSTQNPTKASGTNAEHPERSFLSVGGFGLQVSKPESAQMLERVGVDSVAVLKAAAAEQKAFEATKASDDATTVPP